MLSVCPSLGVGLFDRDCNILRPSSERLGDRYSLEDCSHFVDDIVLLMIERMSNESSAERVQ